jgi:hypothetical protein
MLKDFTRELSPKLLNIEDKKRSNLFAWRGQFSPQLIHSTVVMCHVRFPLL